MANNLVRLSLSIEKPLYKKLEKLVKDNGYSNRSEFVRDLVRDRLVSDEWTAGGEILGTITLVYDHNKRELSERLADLQHQFYREVLASTHVLLDDRLCSEMIMVKGSAKNVKELYDQMKKQRGVLHAELSMSSTGSKLD